MPGRSTLDVINTGGSGLRATLRLDGAAPESRQIAEEILSAFSVPYAIEDAESSLGGSSGDGQA